MTDFGKRPGDMFKSDYDANDNSVVDNSGKLAGSTRSQVQDHTPKSHTHEESEITDLAHDATHIVGKEVNDAAIGDQKVLAYDDGSGKIIYITPAPSGAVLESIQMGEIALGAAETSDTAPITGVDTAKAFLINLGYWGSTAGDTDRECRLELTNATTVTVSRTATGGTVTVRFAVVEFSSGINSIQRGTITLASQKSNTATITGVDTAKTFLSNLGSTTTVSGTDRVKAALELTDATHVQAEADAANATLICGFEAIEFS